VQKKTRAVRHCDAASVPRPAPVHESVVAWPIWKRRASEVKGGLAFDPFRLAVAVLLKWKHTACWLCVSRCDEWEIFALPFLLPHELHDDDSAHPARSHDDHPAISQFEANPFQAASGTAGTIVSVMAIAEAVGKKSGRARPGASAMTETRAGQPGTIALRTRNRFAVTSTLKGSASQGGTAGMGRRDFAPDELNVVV